MSTATLDKLEAEAQTSHNINVTFRVRRFNPEISDEATWQETTDIFSKREIVEVISMQVSLFAYRSRLLESPV